jgi:hypothetical protein
MERVDVNGDGVIQLTEFVAGLVDWKALQNDSQWGYWVQMAFERLDKNGDGWLGLEEIMEQLPQEDGSTDAGGWAGGWAGVPDPGPCAASVGQGGAVSCQQGSQLRCSHLPPQPLTALHLLYPPLPLLPCPTACRAHAGGAAHAAGSRRGWRRPHQVGGWVDAAHRRGESANVGVVAEREGGWVAGRIVLACQSHSVPVHPGSLLLCTASCTALLVCLPYRSQDEFMELLMGTSLPDTLNQYDPRIKLGHFLMDESVLGGVSWWARTRAAGRGAALGAWVGKQQGCMGWAQAGQCMAGGRAPCRRPAALLPGFAWAQARSVGAVTDPTLPSPAPACAICCL